MNKIQCLHRLFAPNASIERLDTKERAMNR